MSSLDMTKIKVAYSTLIFLAIASVLSFVFLEEPLKMVYGLGAGGAIGLLGFLELANTLSKAVTMPPAKAKRYASFKYAVRFLIMGAALALSALSPQVNFLGTAIGMMANKIIIYGTHLFDDSSYYKKIFRKEG